MLSTESGQRQFALGHPASGPGPKCEPRPHVIDPSSVTVAVEGWNAADLDSQEVFRRSLTSLRDQTYPIRECEVFVFQDAEVDLSRMDWIGELIPHAKIVSVPGSTYYRTKNLALQFARGKYLVFADSDVVYDQRWLESLLGCIADGKELIVGWTRYPPGLLSRTLELCDWSATRPISEYTDWFHGNNLAVRRGLFERLRFREDMGLSGGGAVDVLRRQLREDGIRAWFCADAIGYHALAPFLPKRLRIGGYHVHWRRLSPAASWAWMARVPLLAPFLVTGGTLLRACARAWRLRSSLPGSPFTLPVYFLTIALVKAVEAVGAALYTWAPGWISRRYGWYDVPPSGRPQVVGAE